MAMKLISNNYYIWAALFTVVTCTSGKSCETSSITTTKTSQAWTENFRV